MIHPAQADELAKKSLLVALNSLNPTPDFSASGHRACFRSRAGFAAGDFGSVSSASDVVHNWVGDTART
jgi:hypothetical protein